MIYAIPFAGVALLDLIVNNGVSVDYLVGSRSDPNQSRREITTQEKAAYALLLEDSPNIARGGEVGQIVYGHDFQVYILGLLDVLLKDDERTTSLLRALSKIVSSVADPNDKLTHYLQQ